MTASILHWMHENELSDLQGRERPYAAVRSLWAKAQEKAREAASAAADSRQPANEGDQACENVVGGLVRLALFLMRVSRASLAQHMHSMDDK